MEHIFLHLAVNLQYCRLKLTITLLDLSEAIILSYWLRLIATGCEVGLRRPQ